MSTVTMMPPWRNAAAELFAGKYGYGDIVPHDELLAAFYLPKPTGKRTFEEYDQWRLAVLAQQDALAEWLLEERNMMLVAVPGQGYRITPPEQQTEQALERGMKRVRKEINRMARQLHYVDRSALTHEQARANADALARAAWLKSQVNKSKRLRIGDDTKKPQKIGKRED